MDVLKESQLISDIRRFCAEKTNDSRRSVQQREGEREKEDRDLVKFVMPVLSSSGR